MYIPKHLTISIYQYAPIKLGREGRKDEGRKEGKKKGKKGRKKEGRRWEMDQEVGSWGGRVEEAGG